MARVWSWMIFKVTSSSNHSVIFVRVHQAPAVPVVIPNIHLSLCGGCFAFLTSPLHSCAQITRIWCFGGNFAPPWFQNSAKLRAVLFTR